MHFLGLWVIIFHFCLSACAMCYTLSVGHLPPSRNGSTSLLITDLSGLGPAAEIRFYDESGQEVSNVRKLLPPNGKLEINVESYLQTVGTIILESSNERIVAEYWQMNKSGEASMLPLQSPGKESRYFVNCFRFPSCTSNFLVLSDPYGYGPLVQMEFYSKTGEFIKMARKLLRPYGTTAFKVNDYVSWDILGKVSIRSFGGSIALHYRQLCGNGDVLVTPARLPARELLIDEFSTGRDITSNLVITDVSAKGPETEIQFFSRKGNLLYKLEKLLPPSGTVVIDPSDYIGDVSKGIIKISGEAEIIADYWEKNPQSVLDIPAIDKIGSVLFFSYFSPLDRVQNLLSLLNIGQEPVEVEVQFYSSDGNKIDSRRLTLRPYKQVDESTEHYFGGARLGTIIVRGPHMELVGTSNIFDLKKNRHLGKAHAQVIR